MRGGLDTGASAIVILSGLLRLILLNGARRGNHYHQLPPSWSVLGKSLAWVIMANQQGAIWMFRWQTNGVTVHLTLHTAARREAGSCLVRSLNALLGMRCCHLMPSLLLRDLESKPGSSLAARVLFNGPVPELMTEALKTLSLVSLVYRQTT